MPMKPRCPSWMRPPALPPAICLAMPSARLIGMAKPMLVPAPPSDWLFAAVSMPITWPAASDSGPPSRPPRSARWSRCRHSPEELNLALIDFKGGATFAGLEPAPHVAAVITNLSDKAALVARMRDALTGEMNRRQEALRLAGNLDGIAAYDRARRAGAQLARLPVLFIIVDEFSELLSQHPDFADVFVAIGRLGGLHAGVSLPDFLYKLMFDRPRLERVTRCRTYGAE